ncbi:MAG: hypothetical protein H8K10_16070 [Nitrospira sp.]|nr:hypothetical protein [Nitrospira sp.]
MTIPAFTIRLCFVLAYLVLALPLPAALLDHELGLLSGDPAHTVLDDHAWLEHAAGSGFASGDAGIVVADLAVPLSLLAESCGVQAPVASPSVRGPPSTLPS